MIPIYDFFTDIDAYTSQYDEEVAYKRDMLALLKSHPDRCFDRDLIPPGHFTASCMVLGHNGHKTLFTHHAKLDRWVQLGGHADGQSDLLAASIREADEESGLPGILPVMPAIFDIDIHEIPANPKKNEGTHLHYDVRYLLYTPDTDFTVSDESHDLAWLDADTILQTMSEQSIRRMTHKWQDLQRSGQLDALIKALPAGKN